MIWKSIVVAVLAVGMLCGLQGPAQATTRAESVRAAKVAIGAGDGAAGARIIRKAGLANKPEILAEIIYGAGRIAVRDGLGDAFSHAVATAFVSGGVTFGGANRAFVSAAALVIRRAPGDEQLLAELGPGGTAILRTEAAYFHVFLPSLPI